MSEENWKTNVQLHKANREKNDEFYTQLDDIEKELLHYKEHFKGKTVFCNCDDPFESNFFKYFVMNFNQLGLEKLIATWYATSPIAWTQLPLFEEINGKEIKLKAYKIEITEVKDVNGDGRIDLNDVKYLLERKEGVKALKGDWDFRSEESLKLLKEADIIVTNPPFSLFRDYIALLMEYHKKFLVLWNMNAITYKEIFPLIKDNRLWIWYWFNMSMVYETPYPNLLEANRKFVIAKWYNPDDGYVKVPAICRFTNLDIQKRHEDLILYKTYNPHDYPHYDYYDAININKVDEIPVDYEWIMGVPITFLGKYNPEQFEIINWIGRYACIEWTYTNPIWTYWTDINWVHTYFRILIRRKK